MAQERWGAGAARQIHRRVVVTGRLVAQTPLHLGNGDGDDIVDLPLLRDERDEQRRPLLTGASLTGALRAYLRAHEYRERVARARDDYERSSAAVVLFGGVSADPDGPQSALLVADALGNLPGESGVELRDGVRLVPKTRTAAHDALFNLELWPAGTHFDLSLELLLNGDEERDTIRLRALATALTGLNPSPDGITLGARKRRGYGRIAVESWTVASYDLRTPDGLLGWLAAGHPDLAARPKQVETQSGADLATLLGVRRLDDKRRAFTVHMAGSLRGSLLIRSGSGGDDLGPDMVHLHARQPDGTRQPVLSGTSLAGALRVRALRIANTIGAPARVVDDIFGPLPRSTQSRDMDSTAGGQDQQAAADEAPAPGDMGLSASRLSVSEQVVERARTDLIQNRVTIDRFTGGSYPTALFDEQPAFAGPDTTVTLDLRLVNPEHHEIGLLLLVLKDLWTEDLPLGGEQAVGRGRIHGLDATLRLPDSPSPVTIKQPRRDSGVADSFTPLVVSDAMELERHVAALHTWARKGKTARGAKNGQTD